MFFGEPETKCKRHLVNSKYLDSKKLNLNTFIREAPPSSSEQKIHGFPFLKEFTSMCVLVVIFFQLIVAFGYKCLSFYLLPASQLFKVPIGHCYYLAFHPAMGPRALTQTTHGRAACFSDCFLPPGKGWWKQRRSDTVMSLRSSWKCRRPVPGHKGALVGMFIYRMVKT